MVLGAMSEAQGRRWIGRSLLLAALWLMVMLLAIKVRVGWGSESLSLIAGALLTAIASVSLLLSLLALSSPQSTHRDYFGHTRLESGLALLLVGLMGFACCTVLGQAGQQLIGALDGSVIAPPKPITVSLFQLLVSATVMNFMVGIAGYYQAKILSHSALKSSFRQCLLDASGMVFILLGLIGRNLGVYWLDPLLAGMIVMVAIAVGWQLLNRQLPSLLHHVAIAPEAVTAVVSQVEGILHCVVLQSRGLVGRLVYIEMRLTLHPECLTVASTITSRVERVLRQHYGTVETVFHIESGGEGAWQGGRGT